MNTATQDNTKHRSIGPYVMCLCVLPSLAVALGALLSEDLFLPVLLLVGGSILLAVLINPELATPIFVFLAYINAPTIAIHFHNVPEPVAAASLGLLLLPVAKYVLVDRQPLIIGSVLPWLALFCSVQLASLVFATYKSEGLATLLVSITEGLLLFLLVINAVRTQRMLRWVTWALVAAGVFMGGLGVFQKATGSYWRDFKGFAQVSAPDRNAYGEIEGGRWPCGPIGEKNYYAQFMLMLVPLALFRFWGERSPWLRAAGFAAGLIILAGIGLTASRGAAVGFGMVLMALVVLRCISVRHVALIGVTAFLLMLTMPATRERMASLTNLVYVFGGTSTMQQTDVAMQGRLTEMAAAVLVTIDHPVLGAGPGNFPNLFPKKADLLGFQIHNVRRRAHNLYLEIAAELGVIGLFCFLAILATVLRELVHARKETSSPELQQMITAFLLTLIAMMTTGMFLSFAYARYCWLVIALANAAARLGRVQPVPDLPTEQAS